MATAAAARARDGGTPPPIIAKTGRYTVFLTPPATTGKPKSIISPVTASATKFKSPTSPAPNHNPSVTKLKPTSSPMPNEATSVPAPASTKPKPTPSQKPPAIPVQVPPPQFGGQIKDRGKHRGRGGAFGFLWDAIARVQDAHASLDEHLAGWFGLNQSRYQWALNDYYESNGLNLIIQSQEKGSGKPKEHVGKGQNV